MSLQVNSLTGPIPPALSTLVKLTKLLLSDNKLSGSIPGYINTLMPLHIIDISSNKLTGPVPSFFVPLATNHTINISPLSELYLDSNSLDSVIPSSLCQLSFLKMVMLSENSDILCYPDCLADLSGKRPGFKMHMGSTIKCSKCKYGYLLWNDSNLITYWCFIVYLIVWLQIHFLQALLLPILLAPLLSQPP